MTEFGYTLSSEEHAPRTLVDNATRAEEAGFAFLSISDHFHPWLEAQGHSGFVWSVLGGIAARTERVRVGVGVTCPIVRLHPVVVAHAAATCAQLFEGRFFLGVGTGEALNEHVLGHRWPAHDVRLQMLDEAVSIMRELWTGDAVSRRSGFYEVENARLFDPPEHELPVIVSAFGTQTVELAARVGDGLWGHGSDPEPIKHYDEIGGTGPKYAQLNLCWAADAESARKTVQQVWPIGVVKGQLMQDLPTWNHFEQAVSMVPAEEITKNVPCGPAVEPILAAVDKFVEAGYDHVYFHQIGPDQAGFFAFWQSELQPALRRHLGD